MASPYSISILLLLLITITTTVTVTAVPELEYTSLLSALRNRGYHVFANAITTTDLHYDIITGNNFTFFAPIDSVLYTLDMSMSAADYTTTMRFHVVPHRLSLSDLRNLPYGLNSFPTLLNDHEIRIVNPLSLPLPITVEGVYVSVPDLYSDEHVVVHGLESVVDFRSVKDTVNSSSVTDNFTEDHAPMNVHREEHAPSPQVADPVPVAATPQTSVVTRIKSVASPIPVPSSDVSESVIQPHQSSEIKSEPIIQSQQSPEIKSESIIQSKSPEMKSESVIQPHRSPVSKSDSIFQLHQSETKSESIIQSQSPEMKSESLIQSQHLPEVYFESVTQPLEEHVTIATRSELNPQRIHHVSLASKSTGNFEEDFTQVDDAFIDCPIADEDGEQMNIANIRRGDPYTRELYSGTRMTCAHE